MGTDTDMGLALNRRANVFNSRTIDSNPSKDVMGSISALFSVVCGKENNCMSGIAMFTVHGSESFGRTASRANCHI
jgi:hypothetical protein